MRGRPRPATLVRGERLLAWAGTEDGDVVGGSRDALHLPGPDPERLPWEQVAAAEWDTDDRVLRVVEVGTFGEVPPQRVLALVDAERLVTLVRERVTASIVVRREADVRDRRSVRVLGRRAPSGSGPIAWFVEYDAGLDPEDPAVASVVDAALAQARGDVGE